MHKDEKIHVLVNPASSGNGGLEIWQGLAESFESMFAGHERMVSLPQSREEAMELVSSSDADVIVSVSGDGTAHNIAQAVIARPAATRPALAVVPIGSGNDFARSLGVLDTPAKALETVLRGGRVRIDVGMCNGLACLETLSFGVDAAIALATEEKRKSTNRRGFLLYGGVAVSAIIRDLKCHHYRITLDDGQLIDDNLLICAIQNGPSYGGGFKVAPLALLDDGLLNICTATNTNKVFALAALAMMSQGKHEGLQIFHQYVTRKLSIDVDEDIPAQCDGEAIFGRHFDIEIVPKALDVIVGAGAAICNPSKASKQCD